MAKIQIIILTLLPFCFGQFSIQGPSDGNRRAQGLKYSSEKGVEYTDQAASLRTDGFSITGASDGNSNFQIQGATDGNSDFQIQGATDGNSQFQIHGPTDGGSQAYLQNYDPNQNEQNGRSIEYRDPSGQRVNWRSYNRAASKAQAQAQYQEPAPAAQPQRRPTHRRAQPQAAQPKQQPRYQQAPVANINYNPIEKAPPSIQEILQFQAQIPYVNIIPEHLRVDTLSAAHEQAKKFAEEYPKQVLAQQPQQLVIEEAPRNQYRPRPRPAQQQQQQSRGHARERRQAPEYEAYEASQQAYARHRAQQQRRQAPQYSAQYSAQQQQPQQQQQPDLRNYRRVQPTPEPAPRYNNNVPQQIQQILQYQAQIPYDIIANQINYRPDKPYIPEPVQPRQQQPPQQATQPAPDYQQYQGQGQGAAYAPQPQYGNQYQGTRPVNEPQYN